MSESFFHILNAQQQKQSEMVQPRNEYKLPSAPPKPKKLLSQAFSSFKSDQSKIMFCARNVSTITLASDKAQKARQQGKSSSSQQHIFSFNQSQMKKESLALVKVSEFDLSGVTSQQTKILHMPLPQKETSWKQDLRSGRTKAASVLTTPTQVKYSVMGQYNSQINSFIGNQSLVSSQPKRQSDIHERLYKQHEQIKKQREQIHDPDRRAREEELQCDFTAIEHRTGLADSLKVMSPARSESQFVLDMFNFQVERDERLEKLRQLQNEQFLKMQKVQASKQIDKEKAILLKERGKQKVELRKAKLLRDTQPEFKPQLNKNTLQIVANRKCFSYSPPKNYQQSEKEKNDAFQLQLTGQPKSNFSKNDAIIYQKFKRKFDAAIEELGLDQDHLDATQSKSILIHLGFVRDGSNCVLNQQQLTQQLLQLASQDTEQIKRSNLLQILCDLQNIKSKSGQVMISNKVRQEFYPLVLQMQTYLSEQQMQKAENELQNDQTKVVTLIPKINSQKTQEILQNAVNPELNFRLHSSQQVKTEILARPQKKENLAWMRQQLYELEMLDCTFKPKTNTRVFSNPRVYEKVAVKGEDRPKNEIEYEQQYKECTFQPTFFSKKLSKPIRATQGDIITLGKTKANQPNQHRKKLHQAENDNETSNSQLLEINVRISDNESKKLVLKSTQNYKQVVREFCETNGLNEDQQTTLINVISNNTSK